MNYIITNCTSYDIDAAEKIFGEPKVVVGRYQKNNSKAIVLDGRACSNAEYDDSYDYSRLTPELLESLSGCRMVYYRMADQTSFIRETNFKFNAFYKHVAFWVNLLDDVDFIVFGIVPHAGFDWVLYNLARLQGIKCFLFYTMPIRPGFPMMKYAFTDCMRHAKSALPHGFGEDITVHVKNYLEAYANGIDGKYTPFTRKKSPFARVMDKLSKSNKKEPLPLIRKAIFRSAYSVFRAVENDPYSSTAYRKPKTGGKPPLEKYKRILYFPLHYQPEASTNPLGGRFVEQDLLIKMVASVMDSNTCLIVKDHPRRSHKLRYRQFYDDIMQLPQVYLVPADDKGVDYIARADALVGITGTSCWEALFMGKPVLMAGTRIFENAPHIFKIDGPASIKRALKAIDTFKLAEKTRQAYLQSLMPYLFPGHISKADEAYSVLTPEESAQLSMTIIKTNLEKECG